VNDRGRALGQILCGWIMQVSRASLLLAKLPVRVYTRIYEFTMSLPNLAQGCATNDVGL